MRWFSQTWFRLTTHCPLPDTDGSLIQRYLQDRDEASFRELVDRHTPMVYRVCRSVLNHAQDAEDATQATFLVLARSARRIRQTDSLAGWLHAVALKTARNYLRRKIREDRRVRTREASADMPTPTEDISLREAWQVLHQELDRLPEQYKSALVLVYFEEKSHEEAAKALGLSMTVFRGRLERGRAKLAECLARHQITFLASITTLVLTIAAPKSLSASVTTTTLLAISGNPAVVTPLVWKVSTDLVAWGNPKLVALLVAFLATLTVGGVAIINPGAQRNREVSSALESTLDTEPTWSYPTGHMIGATATQFLILSPHNGHVIPLSSMLGAGSIESFQLAHGRPWLAFEVVTPQGRFLNVWDFHQPFPGTREQQDVATYFWSRDGVKLYSALRATPNRVTSRNWVTKEQQTIEFPEGCVPIDVHPDGDTFLACMRDPNPASDHWSIVLSTIKFRSLTSIVSGLTQEQSRDWRFSPDGKWIAGLKRDADGKPRLAAYCLSNGLMMQFAFDSVDRFLGWSPDGQAVLFGTVDVHLGFQSLSWFTFTVQGQPQPHTLPLRLNRSETLFRTMGWKE